MAACWSITRIYLRTEMKPSVTKPGIQVLASALSHSRNFLSSASSQQNVKDVQYRLAECSERTHPWIKFRLITSIIASRSSLFLHARKNCNNWSATQKYMSRSLFHDLHQTAAAMSSASVSLLVVSSEILCSSLSTSAVYIRVAGRGKLELVMGIKSLTDSSDGHSGIAVRSRFSWDLWQTMQPLLHPGKWNDGDPSSLRNE